MGTGRDGNAKEQQNERLNWQAEQRSFREPLQAKRTRQQQAAFEADEAPTQRDLLASEPELARPHPSGSHVASLAQLSREAVQWAHSRGAKTPDEVRREAAAYLKLHAERLTAAFAGAAASGEDDTVPDDSLEDRFERPTY
jgi:hypothetical protein